MYRAPVEDISPHIHRNCWWREWNQAINEGRLGDLKRRSWSQQSWKKQGKFANEELAPLNTRRRCAWREALDNGVVTTAPGWKKSL